MEHLELPQFLFLLVAILGAAKAFGGLAQWIGQPAVLGELVAGVVLGASVLGVVNPEVEVLHLLSELGVIILLFAIGLETDLQKLLNVGGPSLIVAIVGVVLPFAIGYGVCWLWELPKLAAIVAGATLTATSVGITARVLSDLNRLQDRESQIILGAAVIDDVVGLVILAVVSGMANGEDISVGRIFVIAATAFGFLAGTLLIGRLIVPRVGNLYRHIDLPGTATMIALIFALGLALASYHV
jgi:Kef-type K+ transport system membrane component KefB